MNLDRRRLAVSLCLITGLLFPAGLTEAEEGSVLFKNVRIFNGVEPTLAEGHVLVSGNTIAQVSEAPIEPPAGARVIDGGGRVLSPGFIDLHAHVTLGTPKDMLRAHPWVRGAITGKVLESYLRNGFTTVRDAGGTHPELARAVDRGLLTGPRVYPSGAVITQTSGHGDFRMPHDPHPTLCNCGADHTLVDGFSVIADGEAQWLAAVRENFKHGATQIKIMGGGGVASDYDPIHTLQPTPEEIRAAVQAASDWGTYVMAHSYTSPAIRRLVENGVKVIEHGLLIDDDTARLCAEKGVVISTQIAIFRMGAELPGLTEENRAKMQQVLAGQDNLIGLIKKYGLKTGFGTDFVFGIYPRVNEEFAARADYFTPAEILRQATSENAEIVRMAGPLDPYGDFGEIREGWLADLVLIEGEPLEDITVLARPNESLVLVMKDGKIYKDSLPAD
ncbi:MAG: amidohydrolase family protein [bacterium]|nr:amidohydrolase family protein [bacterium]